MAAGDVVNTAARLQAAAPVNGILVGETTYRATATRSSTARREPVRAKGKSEPVPVWEALAARARFGVDVRRPAVRRSSAASEELDLLSDALGRARARARAAARHARRRSGHRQEPARLRALAGGGRRSRAHRRWRQGRSLPVRRRRRPSGRSAEMVKAQAGILETDSPRWPRRSSRRRRGRSSRTRRGAVGRAPSAPARRAAAEASGRRPPRRGLRGLAPLLRGARRAAAARARLRGPPLGRRRPARLRRPPRRLGDRRRRCSSSAPRARSCSSAGPAGAAASANAATLSLSPLSDDEIARLLGGLLEQTVAARRACRRDLLARAGGNPLYAEEYVRMLLAERRRRCRATSCRCPRRCRASSPRGSTRSSAEEKALVQDAAVHRAKCSGAVRSPSIGGAPALDRRGAPARARAQGVRAARAALLGRRQRRSTRSGTSLVRDVAYGQIPRARRAEKHRPPRSGSRRSAPTARTTPRCSPTTTSSALEFARAAGQDTAELERRARLALATRATAPRAQRLRRGGAASTRGARAWPEDDPERPELLFRYGARAVGRAGGAAELLRGRATRCSPPATPSTRPRPRCCSATSTGSRAGAILFARLERALTLLRDRPLAREGEALDSTLAVPHARRAEARGRRVGREALALAQAARARECRRTP